MNRLGFFFEFASTYSYPAAMRIEAQALEWRRPSQFPRSGRRAASAVVKDALRLQTERAVRIGIFGAPSFVVGEELFWGNDRLDAAIGFAQRPSTA